MLVRANACCTVQETLACTTIISQECYWSGHTKRILLQPWTCPCMPSSWHMSAQQSQGSQDSLLLFHLQVVCIAEGLP